MPILALAGQARRWESKRLRLRLLSAAAAARLVTTGRLTAEAGVRDGGSVTHWCDRIRRRDSGRGTSRTCGRNTRKLRGGPAAVHGSTS